MKIGFLLPTVFASPTLYPGRIFAPGPLAVDTINGLVASGHEVHVFSTPDFKTKGILIPGDIEAVRKKLPYAKLTRVATEEAKIRNDEIWKRSFEFSVVTQAYAMAIKEKFDIMHSYHDFLFAPHYVENLTGIPTVYTLHDPLPPEESFEYHEYQKHAEHQFVSISNSQRRSSLHLHYAATVYHGVALDTIPFAAQNLGYLLFMGRLTREKGLHTAIQVAVITGLPLEIGTQFPDGFEGDEYFTKEIKPHLDDPLIHEPGMVLGEKKFLLYKKAKALLFPIEWEEPFGMVIIEAMACGTPVIAYNRGSVAEVVKDGVTGFIIDSDDVDRPGKGTWVIKKRGLEGFIEAVTRISEIDRTNCRKHIEQNFTVGKMVKGYEEVYAQILDSKTGRQ